MLRDFYVQEVEAVFLFQTKTKYLHICRLYLGNVASAWMHVGVYLQDALLILKNR
jgi:hypothetical protein